MTTRPCIIQCTFKPTSPTITGCVTRLSLATRGTHLPRHQCMARPGENCRAVMGRKEVQLRTRWEMDMSVLTHPQVIWSYDRLSSRNDIHLESNVMMWRTEGSSTGATYRGEGFDLDIGEGNTGRQRWQLRRGNLPNLSSFRELWCQNNGGKLDNNILEISCNTLTFSRISVNWNPGVEAWDRLKMS